MFIFEITTPANIAPQDFPRNNSLSIMLFPPHTMDPKTGRMSSLPADPAIKKKLTEHQELQICLYSKSLALHHGCQLFNWKSVKTIYRLIGLRTWGWTLDERKIWYPLNNNSRNLGSSKKNFKTVACLYSFEPTWRADFENRIFNFPDSLWAIPTPWHGYPRRFYPENLYRFVLIFRKSDGFFSLKTTEKS